MTSNLGSEIIREVAQSDGYDRMKSAVMDVVAEHFRPEFINRIDETVVFHALDEAQIRSIARIQMQYLDRRLAERDLGLVVTDAALDQLGQAGFDPVYGARPLKRAIQQQLENPLAQRLLEGEFAPGDVIEVDVAGGGLVFGKRGPAPGVAASA
jgi:ATP-dependent Clp protease ATP-binding subunit ClpB